MQPTAHLIVHGFGGDLGEVEYLRQYLAAQGLDAHTLLLPGHGHTRKALTSANPADWLAAVEAEVARLSRRYAHVTLLGFSMGGLLALCLAGLPPVDRLVLMNTPITFWNLRVIAADVFGGVLRRKPEKLRYYLRSAGKSSLKSDLDFLRVLAQAKRAVRSVRKPVLVAQCLRDETAHRQSADFLETALGAYATVRRYEGGCHQIFTQPSGLREQICADVARFLEG
jgi:carboxylesterase